MNAKEARKLTEESILSTSNKTMVDIDAKIKSAISSHKFCVTFSAPPPEAKVIRDHYSALGYVWKHNTQDQRDGGRSYIEISW